MTIMISTRVNHPHLVFLSFLKGSFGVIFPYISQKLFMYRVYILLFLAIGFSAFAVDSFQSILQAKKITDTSMTLSWSTIPEATKYKIFYDESTLLDPANPNPLLDTDYMIETQ